MQLRPYQSDAVAAVYEHLRNRTDNPCVVIPTGGGKTPVMATICSDAVQTWGGRVLLLAHVKELLEQSADKLRAICPDVRVGVYSASLRRRDTQQSVIVAGIQSVYEKACDLGAFDLVLIDEAHLIPPDGDGMYRTFLDDAKVVNPNVRCVGMTATPFRMKTGTICHRDNILNHVCYEVSVRDLIEQGYLSNLVSRGGKEKADVSKVRIQAGEFNLNQLEDAMNEDRLVESACEEIVSLTADRKSVLIFTAGLKHGRHVADVLAKKHGVECGFVCGETPDKVRARLLQRFQGKKTDLYCDGPMKYLANVNVLTTGFDAPNVDCVVLLRPTMSPGLYYQMVGRGFRLHPGKTDCLVLDFAGNVERHGPVDAITAIPNRKAGDGQAPVKTCPECGNFVATAVMVCPHCEHVFPPPEKQTHEEKPTKLGVLTGQVNDEIHDVTDTHYRIHEKRSDPNAPKTLRVDYQCGLAHWESEWVCFDHAPGSFARDKAAAWWRARSPDPVPQSVADAKALADAGALRQTTSITVREIAGQKFPKIVKYEFGPMPEPVEAGREILEEVPF